MPALTLAQFAYRRADGLLPAINLRNCFLEKAPTELKTQVALLDRPALQPFAYLGTGPIRGVFREAGAVFGDDAVVVSGSEVYRLTQGAASTDLGDTNGTGRVDVAMSPTEALIASGGLLQTSSSGALSNKTFPDSANVVTVGFINGYFLAVKENSSRIYYTDLTTGEFSGSRFLSAERYADPVVKLIVTSDEVWAFGPASVEVFVPTGQDAASSPPFQRVEGRLYKKGVLNAATIVAADNTIFWAGVAEDGALAVYRGDAVPVVISDASVSERLTRADPDVLKGWVFGMMGHTFYVLAMGDQGTWVFDITTGAWQEWASFNRDQWRAHTGRACWPGVVLAGDDEEGIVWALDDEAAQDDETPIERVYTAGVAIEARPVCDNVSLDCAVGQVGLLDPLPTINLRHSDDQGRTWVDDGSREIGARGAYETRVRWTRMGMMRPPARIFEWRTTDKVRMRVTGARINEAF